MSVRVDLFETVVSDRTRWSFVRIETADGFVGHGECSDSGADGVLQTLLAKAATELVALADDVREPAPIAEAVTAALGPSPTLSWRTVVGGVEQAICEIAAKRANVPLWKWLGGVARVTVPLYANINRVVGERRPRDIAEAGVAAAAAGFTTVKCAPFDTPLADHTLSTAGLARVEALRSEIGSDIAVYVDCHERLLLADVVRLLPDLDALGIGWLEDATSCADLDGLRVLRAGSTVRIAGGELVSAPDEIMPALGLGLIDVVMPDVKHAGGLLRAARIAAAAARAQVSPHNPSGPIGTAVSAHLSASLPNFSVLEFAYGEADWRAELVDGAEIIQGGQLHLAEGSGLGLDLLTTHPAVRHIQSLVLEER